MRLSRFAAPGMFSKTTSAWMSAVLLTAWLSLSFVPAQAIATDVSPVEILVRLTGPNAVPKLASAMQLPVRDIGLAELGIYGLDTSQTQVEATIVKLRTTPWVIDVEPNYPIQAMDEVPNDPAYPDQYALAAIHAPQGWEIENGSPNIRIAIIDSGVDFNHPDLAGQLLPGFDFINIDENPQDDYGHGTAVAGVAAAATNNGIGMAGVGWQVKILPVKVLGANGSGTYADVAAGIVWASYQGVQVMNLSLGGSNASFTLEDAVNFAADKGILLVAASGNNGREGVLYPARYPQVIAVAATDRSNGHPSFSTFGPDIDVSAPGVQVLTTSLGGEYSTRSGTSFAAPHVSGLSALLFSLPGQIQADQVRAAIEASALDIGEPGWDPYTGAGLIQVDGAMLAIDPLSQNSVENSPTLNSTPPAVQVGGQQGSSPSTPPEKTLGADLGFQQFQGTDNPGLVPPADMGTTLPGNPPLDTKTSPREDSTPVGIGLVVVGIGLGLFFLFLRIPGRR